MPDNPVTTVLAVLASLSVLVGIALRVAALGIIPARRKPSTGMAWLLLVLLAPALGLIAFAFFGSARLGRRREQRLRRINAVIAERATPLQPREEPRDVPAYVTSAVRLNHHLASLPLSHDNTVTLLEDYAGSVAAMTEAVRKAERYVHVEFYITALDDLTRPLLDALGDAVRRGVAVRLLLDHLGSRGIPGWPDLRRALDASGVDWHPMLPIAPLQGKFRRPDLRNHRKLLVVDGVVGFMGSQNLTEPGYNKPKNHRLGREWVELMVRLRGPVVASLEAVFASDWALETGGVLDVVPGPPAGEAQPGEVSGASCQVVPSGPGYAAENNLLLFTTLVYGATRRLSITSPYFVPDESLLYAVTTAARRGVAVELFVSEVSDQFMVGHAQNSYYEALLEAGVRIHRYPAPYVLHAKHFSVDDDVVVIGSSNMDQRSFALNFEVSLMMTGADVVAAVRRVEDRYRALSRELTLEEWGRRGPGRRYVDTVMRLTAALQ
ncbi:cardiolipin synthase [Nocardioides sp. J2M5]|uniref:cardiolipin synthase n=1 Tax=Nocardioides palaemonis TaxID=2829810 RepID=UPI001BA73887|nr:cardiolipin synthase [Nocardioides palaemonis]MBS2940065.1 cardiolipin synthase [Nocardioides palaemonis]